MLLGDADKGLEARLPLSTQKESASRRLGLSCTGSALGQGATSVLNRKVARICKRALNSAPAFLRRGASVNDDFLAMRLCRTTRCRTSLALVQVLGLGQ